MQIHDDDSRWILDKYGCQITWCSKRHCFANIYIYFLGREISGGSALYFRKIFTLRCGVISFSSCELVTILTGRGHSTAAFCTEVFWKRDVGEIALYVRQIFTVWSHWWWYFIMLVLVLRRGDHQGMGAFYTKLICNFRSIHYPFESEISETLYWIFVKPLLEGYVMVQFNIAVSISSKFWWSDTGRFIQKFANF